MMSHGAVLLQYYRAANGAIVAVSSSLCTASLVAFLFLLSIWEIITDDCQLVLAFGNYRAFDAAQALCCFVLFFQCKSIHDLLHLLLEIIAYSLWKSCAQFLWICQNLGLQKILELFRSCRIKWSFLQVGQISRVLPKAFSLLVDEITNDAEREKRELLPGWVSKATLSFSNYFTFTSMKGAFLSQWLCPCSHCSHAWPTTFLLICRRAVIQEDELIQQMCMKNVNMKKWHSELGPNSLS